MEKVFFFIGGVSGITVGVATLFYGYEPSTVNTAGAFFVIGLMLFVDLLTTP